MDVILSRVKEIIAQSMSGTKSVPHKNEIIIDPSVIDINEYKEIVLKILKKNKD